MPVEGESWRVATGVPLASRSVTVAPTHDSGGVIEPWSDWERTVSGTDSTTTGRAANWRVRHAEVGDQDSEPVPRVATRQRSWSPTTAVTGAVHCDTSPETVVVSPACVTPARVWVHSMRASACGVPSTGRCTQARVGGTSTGPQPLSVAVGVSGAAPAAVEAPARSHAPSGASCLSGLIR